ncbi:MAG TPA: ABC transporter ATP-binding protein [Gemmatimonadales bacterium]|nr:ABC transporter ATP-binding protein [Gemmatimonadales bacterium]
MNSAGPPAAIEVTGLTRVFGANRALDGIDLRVREGIVFGFLGPNGAGKTTTLKILTGLIRPSGGTARIFGRNVADATGESRSELGFLPDVPAFYPWMTATDFLQFAGRLFGLDGAVLNERIQTLLGLAGLTGVTTRIGGYSRGMKQRLGIAQALINAPRLLLLDEPTSALDPIGRKEVLDLIASLRGKTTVFFSSHILSDIERVCDEVAILSRGRVAAQAPTEELKARSGGDVIVVEVAGGVAGLRSALEGAAWLSRIEQDGETLRLTVRDLPEARRAVPRAIASAGLELRRFDTGEATLEEVFVELVGGHAP